MKGVVIDYKEDKGYGFLRDENGDNRFFHISYIQQRKQFLDNLLDYHYTDFEERTCLILTFTPHENEKRQLGAANIKLTNEILNNKLNKASFKAKIIKVSYDVSSVTRTVQGIKKGMPAPFNATAGSHGTYRIGYPEVSRELNIDFIRTDDIGWGTIDVRELVLRLNNREKITDVLVDSLQRKLFDRTIIIHSNGKEWILKDSSILII